MNDWAKIVAQVGFPIVVALILLGMLAGIVPSPFAATVAAFAQHQATLEAHAAHDAQLVHLLQRLCFNTSKTDLDREACWRN